LADSRDGDVVREGVYGQLLQKDFTERRLHASQISIRVVGDTAWAVFDWTFTAKLASGQPITTKGWESHGYKRTREGWRIVHLHYSVPPPAVTVARFSSRLIAFTAADFDDA
jgi:ketosteroid isomerase-like protein